MLTNPPPPDPSERKPRSEFSHYLPRLKREFYQADAVVFWTMPTHVRRAGSHGSTSAKMADATFFRQALGNCPNSCCLAKSDGEAGAIGESVGVSLAMSFGWMAAVVTSSATMIATSGALSMLMKADCFQRKVAEAQRILTTDEHRWTRIFSKLRRKRGQLAATWFNLGKTFQIQLA